MAIKKIARVFIKKTQYTPEDDLVFFGSPGLLLPEIDEVHISCLFSWDKTYAEQLASNWRVVAPTKIGGPAYPESYGNHEFVPGRYLKKDEFTFTSRGCPRKCPFCLVSKQEGTKMRELKKINPAPYLMDNNILACSDAHIKKVFEMLLTQKNVKLQGGIDARLLKKWHVEYLKEMHLNNIALAYDIPNVYKYLEKAIEMLLDNGIPHGKLHCFVLGGFFKWDTPEKAEQRCKETLKLGATPTAMYFRGIDELVHKTQKKWNEWIRNWSWQRGIYARAKRKNFETIQTRRKSNGNKKTKNKK